MENMEDVIALFGGIYKGKTVLITGNTGFKGSWLAFWLLKMGANVIGYSKDIVSEPSHFSIIDLNYKTYFSNVLDEESLQKVFFENKPEIVFHLAAQSLVLESYHNPVETYKTNVLGTLNVLVVAKNCKSVKAFINVTSDKVYENIETNKPYLEDDRLGGFDMYSSSKACSEILTSSYRRSFLKEKLLLASVRAGNVIGGGDWAQNRLISDLMKATANNEICEIRSPNSIRPWQHVLEPLSGYLLLGQELLNGERQFVGAWNFGPKKNAGISVKDMIQMIKNEWTEINFRFSEDSNYHEAKKLYISSAKANRLLEWKQVWNSKKTIEKTAKWYKNYYLLKNVNTFDDLDSYIKDAKEKKIIWTL